MAFTVKDWRDYPDTTTPITAAAMEDMETRLAAYAEQVSGTVVTSLPGSPVDGQVVHYLADATNGVVWRLRYRAFQADGTTANPSAYKWECVGGEALSSEIDTDEARSNAAYGDLTTVGPSITLPLAGDYMLEYGMNGYMSVAGQAAVMSPAIGAAAASDSDWVLVGAGAAGSFTTASGSRRRRKNGIAAATAVVLKYKTGPSGSVNFRNRWLTARPVRVG